MRSRNQFPVWLLILFISISSIFCSINGWTQANQHWRYWTSLDGLRERWTSRITIGPSGHIWINHGDVNQMSILDGFHTKKISSPGYYKDDTIFEHGGNSIYESSSGQLWTNYPNGLKRFEHGEWIAYELGMIGARGFIPTTDNKVLYIQPDKLVEFNASSGSSTLVKYATDTSLEQFNEIITSRDGNAWITGKKGLVKLDYKKGVIQPSTKWTPYLFETDLGIENLKFPIEGKLNEISGVANLIDSPIRVQVHFDGNSWKFLFPIEESAGITVSWLDDLNKLWFIKNQKVCLMDNGQEIQTAKEKGLQGNIGNVLVEPNGIFWISNWEGVARYTPSTWETPSVLSDLRIHELFEDPKGRFWLTSLDSIFLLKENRIKEFPFPKGYSLNRMGVIFGIFSLRDERLVIGHWQNYILLFDPQREEFEVVHHPKGWIIRYLFQMRDGKIIAETSKTKSSEDRLHFRLEIFDGNDFEIFLDDGYKLNIGIHPAMLETGNGDLWLAGTDGIARYRDGTYKTFGPEDGYLEKGAQTILEVNPGRIWFGTVDRIIEFDGEKWTPVLENVDESKSMIKSSDGSIWVASGTGVFRFFEGSWVENTHQDGLPKVNLLRVLEDSKKRIWVTTGYGVVMVHNKDADQDAPEVTINSQNQKEISSQGNAQFSYDGRDKWKYTDSNRLLYSHRIDDGNWSSFTSGIVASETGLEAGKHVFQVKAMDRNWNESEPVSWDFEVLLPWYKEMGFIIITILSLVLFYYAINRHFKLRLSYKTLRRTQNQLIQSEKMASLGQLVAGVAHEINNPINFIKSNIQPLKEYLFGYKKVINRILEKKDLTPDQKMTELERIVEEEELQYAGEDSDKLIASFKDGSDRIAQIVSDLRHYIRVEKDYQSSYDLHEAIDSTLSLIEGLGDRITIHKEYNDIPKVHCSPGQINQVFVNILKNAAEFIEGEGHIWITTSQEAENVVITICDDGKGIQPDNLSKVFDPFFTTKPVGSGTGLGLSLSYGIIEQHGGSITVKSELDKGTTFTLCLPIKEE